VIESFGSQDEKGASWLKNYFIERQAALSGLYAAISFVQWRVSAAASFEARHDWLQHSAQTFLGLRFAFLEWWSSALGEVEVSEQTTCRFREALSPTRVRTVACRTNNSGTLEDAHTTSSES